MRRVGRAWRSDLQTIADSDRAAGDRSRRNTLHGTDRIVTTFELTAYVAATGPRRTVAQPSAA